MSTGQKVLRLLLIPIVLLSSSLCGCSLPDDDGLPSIIPGVFSLSDHQKLTDVGAGVTRIILNDTYIQDFYDAVDGGTPYTNIEKYKVLEDTHDAGIKIIVTVRWPEDDGSGKDRVPTGDDRTDSLALLTRFLEDFGPIIDVYSLQNEVGTSDAPGTYSDEDMTPDDSGVIPAIDWWQDLLDTAQGLIDTDSSLSHLEIASPAPTLLKRAVFLPSSLVESEYLVKANFFFQTIDFAQSNDIYLDIHLLNFSLSQIESTLEYLEGEFQGPIIVTEWSGVEAVGVWLDEVLDSDFRDDHSGSIDFAGIETNREFIEHTYGTPVSSDVWNDFALLVPGENDFVRESLDIMDDYGVVYACWALGYQYGEPLYDVKTLYTNMSTGSDDDRNTTVYNAVREALLEY